MNYTSKLLEQAIHDMSQLPGYRDTYSLAADIAPAAEFEGENTNPHLQT
ncbi:MAG: hypothetical protein ABI045_00350 [Flavobacteriales bacterium]